jgi:hypothetical protein
VDFHILNNRTYVINSSEDWDSIKDFIRLVLKKININLEIDEFYHEDNHENYDCYKLITSDRKVFYLKISFDENSKILERENFILQKTKGVASGVVKFYGKVELHENISCLLFQFPNCFNVRNLGRGLLLDNIEVFLDSYKSFCQTKPSKLKYKSVLSNQIKSWDIEKNFSETAKESIKHNTDYNKIVFIQKTLGDDLISCIPEVEKGSTCISSLSLDSIYFSKNLFYFDCLQNTCCYHPLVDLVDIFLNFGVKEEKEKEILDKFYQYYNVFHDQNFYDEIYIMQSKKKLLELLFSYLREVYMFRSTRLDTIINISNEFHNCYGKFKNIGTFLDNKKFLFDLITEPIFGKKV